MSRNLEETPSVLKILFQRGTYDIITGEAIKNEPIVSIPLEFLYKQPSINFRISYILVSLINHDGDSLNCGHYMSDFFDAKTGIWWRCDYENITQIIDLSNGVYYRETHKNTKKKKLMSGSTYVLFVVYIITSHMKNIAPFFFKNSPTCPKSII